MAGSAIGAQTYTLRDFLKTPADIRSTMKRVRELGYEAVQLSGLGPIDPGELQTIMQGEGLKVAATHTSYERIVHLKDVEMQACHTWRDSS